MLSPGAYSSVHVTLSPPEYEGLKPKISELLTQLLDGLSPLGTLHLLNLNSSLLDLPSELTLAGFNVLSAIPVEGTIIAQKPAHIPGVAFSLKTKSSMAAASTTATTATLNSKTSPAPLALRRRIDPERKASKKALWTLTSSPSTPSIDANQLLTEADKKRPEACEPVSKGSAANGGGPRRKKACKNCTCGLAELEAEELRSSKVVMLDGIVDGEAKEVEQEQAERERLAGAARAAPKATSSCGSCFLGDAFRCASCPYLGKFFLCFGFYSIYFFTLRSCIVAVLALALFSCLAIGGDRVIWLTLTPLFWRCRSSCFQAWREGGDRFRDG